MPMTSISASGQDAITRRIDVETDRTANGLLPSQFEDFYEIERAVDEIVGGNHKRIALQFPDELLHDSVPVYRLLKDRVGTERELYVLADTSYGSCCVDEVAARHVNADLIIHYGHACLSLPSELPVVYVFGKKPLDIEECVSSFARVLTNQEKLDKTLLVFRHDVAYTHLAETVVSKLRQVIAPLQLSLTYSKNPTKLSPPTKHSSEACHRDHPIENAAIFYLGGESLGLTNLLLTHSSCEVHSYDPETKSTRLESPRTNKLLMRRYALVQKARDADVFGILVGTVGVAFYLPLISHLRTLLSRAKKKSYTISVGKLNPAKLANFLEIECFVLVACPENSLIDTKEFLKPIVTPFELEVALQAEQSWTGQYVLDFKKLLDDHSSNGEQDHGENVEEEDRPMFSLVTGTYRHVKRYGGNGPRVTQDTDGESSKSVILRDQDSTISKFTDSAAALYLQNRTFKGLEAGIGQDEPSTLRQGRSGIARAYQDDQYAPTPTVAQ